MGDHLDQEAGALLGRLLTRASIEVEEVDSLQKAIDRLQKRGVAPGLVDLAIKHLGQIHLSNLGASMAHLLNQIPRRRMDCGPPMDFSVRTTDLLWRGTRK